jgi:hypothetical protein
MGNFRVLEDFWGFFEMVLVIFRRMGYLGILMEIRVDLG